MPDALHYYRRLCGITHPSSASIEYLYQDRIRERGAFKLAASNDAPAIDGICAEFPKGLRTSMMMSCNPPLLILRVLHKFKVHPRLPAFKRVDRTAIKGWRISSGHWGPSFSFYVLGPSTKRTGLGQARSGRRLAKLRFAYEMLWNKSADGRPPGSSRIQSDDLQSDLQVTGL
jgi:hypothetical protein